MGCPCKGSTPRQLTPRRRQQAEAKTQAGGGAMDAGPGTPGYTWNGPPRREKKPADSEKS